MGHGYSDLFEKEKERDAKLLKHKKDIYDKIKNKPLSEFTVEELNYIILLIGCKPNIMAEKEVSEFSLSEIEKALIK
jgi:hypothetical protein